MKNWLALLLSLICVAAQADTLKPAQTIILPGTITANLCAPGVCIGSGAAPTTVSCTSVSQWFHVGSAISHTVFQTASTTNSIALFTLPAGCIIEAVKIKHSVAFAGTAITGYSISVGISGNNAKYSSAFNVLQAVSATAFQLPVDWIEESETSTAAVTITAVSTGANLSASTAGVVDVWAKLSSGV